MSTHSLRPHATSQALLQSPTHSFDSQSMCVSPRKPQRPGTTKEGRNATKQTAAAVNPNNRQSAPLTDQTLDYTTRSIHESSRTTFVVIQYQPQTPCDNIAARTSNAPGPHHTNPAGPTRQTPISSRNPVRGAGGPGL